MNRSLVRQVVFRVGKDCYHIDVFTNGDKFKFKVLKNGKLNKALSYSVDDDLRSLTVLKNVLSNLYQIANELMFGSKLVLGDDVGALEQKFIKNVPFTFNKNKFEIWFIKTRFGYIVRCFRLDRDGGRYDIFASRMGKDLLESEEGVKTLSASKPPNRG